jgi:hypothetical protein
MEREFNQEYNSIINFSIRRGDTFKSSQNEVSTNLGSRPEIYNQQRPMSEISITSNERNFLNLLPRDSNLNSNLNFDNLSNDNPIHNETNDKFSEEDISKIEEATNHKNFSNKNHQNKNLLYVLDANGSLDSEFAFNIIIKEFIHNGRLLVSYLFDSTKDEEYNYNNRKDVVMSRFEVLLLTHLEEKKYKFIKKDKKYFTQYDNPQELANELGIKNNANFMFCGFKGLKGPFARNEELERGLTYLLSESRMPTVIIKEENFRVMKKRPQTGYKWLFVFDRNSSYCYKILPAFSHLIDAENDTVDAMTLLPSFIHFDDIKKNFYEFLGNMGYDLNKSNYEAIEYKKAPSTYVIEKINFGESPFYDFVVFYNNPINFKNEVYKENNESFKIAMKAYCNVCFLNGGLYKQIEENLSSYI